MAWIEGQTEPGNAFAQFARGCGKFRQGADPGWHRQDQAFRLDQLHELTQARDLGIQAAGVRGGGHAEQRHRGQPCESADRLELMPIFLLALDVELDAERCRRQAWPDADAQRRLDGVFGDLRGLLLGYAVVWVGDDGSENDADQLEDGRPPVAEARSLVNPGAGVISLKVVAWGPRGSRRELDIVVERADPAAQEGILIRSWREGR